MMGDSNDDSSDELEKSRSQIGDFAKNVSETVENLVKKLKKEKLANQNLSASFAESEKRNEFLKLELGEVRKKNELLEENMQAINADKENLQNNYEDVQKESESLNLELTELKSAFLSAENTFKSLSNIVKTSATPKIVPKKSEKVQRAQISHSNDGDEEISDLMPDQQAVQTTDDQMQIIPQSEEQEQQQQPMEVTQLENTIAPPMPTSPTQVPSQFLVQRSPKNTSIEGSLLKIPDTPGTSGTSGLQSSLANNDFQLTVEGYVYQSPITLPNVAKATRDDPGEEIIKTEIEAKELQQQPMRLTQLENTISPPMATLSNQVPTQSVMQSSPKNTSNKSGNLLLCLK
jgi:hypothetical protein